MIKVQAPVPKLVCDGDQPITISVLLAQPHTSSCPSASHHTGLSASNESYSSGALAQAYVLDINQMEVKKHTEARGPAPSGSHLQL